MKLLVGSLAVIFVTGLALAQFYSKDASKALRKNPSCPQYSFDSPRVLIEFTEAFRGHSITDLFIEDLNNDHHDDFVFTSLKLDARETKSPLGIFLSGPEGKYEQINIEGISGFYHARHITFSDMDGDGFKEILVADHGPDQEPFPGAQSAVIENVKGKNLKGHLIPVPAAFTFNISPVILGNRQLVLLNNFANGKGPGLRLLEVKLEPGKLEVKDLNKLLPIKALSSCYMTSLTKNVFGDANEEIILGGCDQPSPWTAVKSDLILEWDGSEYRVSQTLPDRGENATWASAAWDVADLNSDGKPDLLRATHDFGFKNAQIDVLLHDTDQNGKSTFRKLDALFQMPVKDVGFIPWVYSIGEFLFFNLTLPFFNRQADAIQRSFLYQFDGVSLIDRSECLSEPVRKSFDRFAVHEDRLYFYNNTRLSSIPKK